jgi:hypothetical protein
MNAVRVVKRVIVWNHRRRERCKMRTNNEVQDILEGADIVQFIWMDRESMAK